MATESIYQFSAIPKRVKLTFTYLEDPNADDEKIVTEKFWAYYKGAGCPTPIVLELDNIDVRYEQDYPDPTERETLSGEEYVARARRANYIRFRDMLVAVVPGLPIEAANVLVSPDDDGNSPGLKALEMLGYRQPLVETADEEESSEGSDKGEVQRVDETGLLPLPTPMPSTQD